MELNSKTVRARRLLTVLTAIMIAGSASVGTAWADPKPTPAAPSANVPPAGSVPGGFRSWGELMHMQQRLVAAADRIVGARGNGYAGVIAAPENRELRVYWKGTPPAAVEGLVRDLRQEVAVTILPAAYSEKELLIEAHRLVRQPGVSAVAPNADGSGLTVSLRSRALAESATLATTFKINRTYGVPSLTSRGDDWAPYWGGARWNGCSTGFAVWVGGTTRMLSAGHCADNGWGAYDGGGQYMGVVSNDNNAYDRLLINAWSAGRIYDGGVGSGEFSKPVVGAAHSYVGNWVCTSGAYSGAVCSIQVKAVDQTINVGYLIYQTVMAEQSGHNNAAGNGDSGGPVFDLTPDWSATIAKGTLTAIDLNTSVACTGIPAGGGRSCAWRFYYVDVVNSMAEYGASIVTG